MGGSINSEEKRPVVIGGQSFRSNSSAGTLVRIVWHYQWLLSTETESYYTIVLVRYTKYRISKVNVDLINFKL